MVGIVLFCKNIVKERKNYYRKEANKLMNISPISSRINNTGFIKQNKTPIQSITLKAETPITLGDIGAKPFTMKLFERGGFEWSGSLRIQDSPAGSRVTPEQMEAAYLSRSYTAAEHQKASHLGAVITDLYSLAQKDRDTSSFNEVMKLSEVSRQEIEDALTRLGINIHEPFTLNGKNFILNDGILNKYDEVI